MDRVALRSARARGSRFVERDPDRLGAAKVCYRKRLIGVVWDPLLSAGGAIEVGTSAGGVG